MKKKTVQFAIAVTVCLALGFWISNRWETWFHNPEEPPYTAPSEPSRVMLTFGDEGELSRYVSWMCDTVVDSQARLYLVQGEDTVRIEAVGEVFQSRSGKAAYYRAHLSGLLPNVGYSYSVETNNSRSEWYHFRTSDPQSSEFTFLYVGDVQDTIGGIANQLIREAVRRHPEVEFLACGGDLCERPIDSYWGETFRSVDSICTAMPILNVTGNHDYLKYLIRQCERRFSLVFPYFLKGMEERGDENHLFQLRYHNTEFFLLDSDRGIGFLYGQKSWLEKAFATSSAAHRIVMLHHPIYSVKKKNNNLEVRWLFNDLIRESGVELVLQGHEHAYTHCTSDEAPLLSADCTRPPLYTVSHCSPKNYRIKPTERFAPVYKEGRYYQIVRVSAEAVTMLGYDANTGERIDSVRIEDEMKKIE